MITNLFVLNFRFLF